MKKEELIVLAVNHVDWWIRTVRQPMIEEFVHGFKHGQEYAEEQFAKQRLAELEYEKEGTSTSDRNTVTMEPGSPDCLDSRLFESTSRQEDD